MAAVELSTGRLLAGPVYIYGDSTTALVVYGGWSAAEQQVNLPQKRRAAR